MNDHIMVAFKNDKRLKREQIISERKFPVTNVFYDKNHTYTVLDLSEKEEFERYILALSEFIINKYEPKILKRIIKKNYPEIPNNIVGEIIDIKEELDERKRKSVLLRILRGYFLENDSASIEGIVIFRLFEYKALLKNIADDLVDIYYLKREYEDFIELLKYFISIQTDRINMLYIVVNDGLMYSLLDENERDITKEIMFDLISPSEVKDAIYDDLLISMLVSTAPLKIVVKNKEKIKNKKLFETIEKVFENIEYR